VSVPVIRGARPFRNDVAVPDRPPRTRSVLRRVLALAVALACAAPLAACSGGASRGSLSPSAEHPNIVFVLADDYSMNLVDHMPQLQRMQADGRTMSRHYVVDSLCCPSRASIFTGRYPHDTGVFTNAGADGGIEAFRSFGNQQRCFAVPMQRAGYRTAFMGKYLNGYQPTTMGPEPGWDEWVVGGGGGYGEFDYDLNVNGRVVHHGDRAQDYMVDVLSRKATGFIRRSAAADQAFLLEVATYAPHDPYVPAPRYLGTKAGVPYPRTAAWDAEVSDAPSWLRGHEPLRADEKTQIQLAWERRLEADLAIDDLIGSIREAIADSGIERETYVVFSSDNGYHMGEYRLTPGKQTAFDTDTHVPLVVTGPGVPAGTTSDALTSSIDLGPTFLDVSGVGTDPEADGTSLAAVWHGRDPADWQEGVLIEHHHRAGIPEGPDLQNDRQADPPAYAAVRTRDALYVRYASGEQEYYDTRTDPEQLTNLARSGVPERLQRMLTALESCHGERSCQAAARTG
jgi:N-acetylglucosamine-6-sulfatase